jgi:radical SAM superfamily enzyme YgiQ (UPF0313 family)
MKILLIGVNAKYVHTNLAIRNIAAFCGLEDIEIFEGTINDNMDDILDEIIFKQPDIVAFSCYIWNIEDIHYLAENLKKVRPEVVIVFGGPEVSYDAGEVLKGCDYVDFIIVGEGELSFKKLIDAMRGYLSFEEVPGLAYRRNGGIRVNERGPFVSLDGIPFSYDESEDLKNRIVYYETSRGCPFRCAFCLSSLDSTVRVASLDKVERDFSYFVNKNVPLVKLVDRSFNCNPERAVAILNIIKRLGGDTVFHCEVNPELVNNRFLEALEGIEERLRFEVGIQTTNPVSLKEISRNPDFKKAIKGVELLKKAGIKLHVDLIAGLPYDDFASFSEAFDDVYRLEPDEIQLGFLKLLKGTVLREKAKEYGIVYRSCAPYEILYNRWIGYEELSVLKGIAKLIDKYYNTGRFKFTLGYLAKTFKRPFDFYYEMYRYWRGKGLFRKELSLKSLYDYLEDFSKTLKVEEMLVKDLIKFDFFYSGGKGSVPDCVELKEDRKLKDKVRLILSDRHWLEQNLPEAQSLSERELWKKINYGIFRYDLTNDFRKNEIGIIFFYNKGKTCFAKINE